MKSIFLIFFLIFSNSFLLSEDNLKITPLFLTSPFGWTDLRIHSSSELTMRFPFEYSLVVKNNKVLAISPGKVTAITQNENGFSVEITNSNIISFTYKNLIDCKVKNNDNIIIGTELGNIESEQRQVQPVYLISNLLSKNNISLLDNSKLEFYSPNYSYVFSSTDGSIIDFGYNPDDGSYIDIVANTFIFRYKYLQGYWEKKNQLVHQTEVIAYSGFTGSIDKPTLGLEILNKNKSLFYFWIFVQY
jgi:hypothetical protein